MSRILCILFGLHHYADCETLRGDRFWGECLWCSRCGEVKALGFRYPKHMRDMLSRTPEARDDDR